MTEPKYKIGQIVYHIEKTTKDAVCEHCKSHYQAFDKYVVWDCKITNVILDDEDSDVPRYCMDHRDKYFVYGGSEYEDEIYETPKEAKIVCRQMNGELPAPPPKGK